MVAGHHQIVVRTVHELNGGLPFGDVDEGFALDHIAGAE